MNTTKNVTPASIVTYIFLQNTLHISFSIAELPMNWLEMVLYLGTPLLH